ncbi:hypothetical protein LEL_02513 [Akanthomyces lecanii RCEF 1005]|uniref:Uncharacterized protein n=1 Tax=Akanthomyces lecanii RCEF 1005 TaxID=1081108 RepID=A0A168IBE0_CORDF|nr:hypothetical protein LEL_02513 [Akanthomyces lecanii RCEF 1005]
MLKAEREACRQQPIEQNKTALEARRQQVADELEAGRQQLIDKKLDDRQRLNEEKVQALHDKVLELEARVLVRTLGRDGSVRLDVGAGNDLNGGIGAGLDGGAGAGAAVNSGLGVGTGGGPEGGLGSNVCLNGQGLDVDLGDPGASAGG